MQLKIQIHLKEPCSLPLAYHHIVQSALYGLMKEPGAQYSIYHNGGACYGKRIYRLFTFGLLKGRFRIEKKRIIFSDSICLEVRSIEEHCLGLVETGLKEHGIQLDGNIYRDVTAEISHDTVGADDVFIRMESPICVYSTDRQTKHTTFFNPDEERFYEAVNSNFIRKYQAVFSRNPESGIQLEAAEIRMKDKYVTRYKGYYISGWKGKYRLSGRQEYLDFLYQAGLGGKNSQGFGMFSVVD